MNYPIFPTLLTGRWGDREQSNTQIPEIRFGQTDVALRNNQRLYNAVTLSVVGVTKQKKTIDNFLKRRKGQLFEFRTVSPEISGDLFHCKSWQWRALGFKTWEFSAEFIKSTRSAT